MSNINLIAFGTFGDPNGFTQTFFSGNPNNTVKAFDIRGSIRLFPNSKLYSIRKESINGFNMISYSVYTYAKEPTSAREGSFIGSAILLTGKKKLDESIIISNLNEFHENLITKNVENDTIKVNHSDKFVVSKPKDFDKISGNLINVDGNLNLVQTNKSLVTFCETSSEKLQNFFEKSIDLMNVYDTIFFTQSEEVAKFAAQKGIFKFIQQVGNKNEFDQEIEKLQEERKQKITNAIARFEREKLQFEEERKRVLEDLQKQIAHNQQKHSENGKKINEANSNLNNLNTVYQRFSKKFDELISGLNSDKKLEEINNSYKEYKINFEEEKRKLENISSIQSLPNSGIPFNSSQDMYSNNHHQVNEDRKGNNENNKVYVLLSISVIINIILIIGAIAYFTIFHPEEQDKSSDDTNQEQPITQENFSNSLQTKLNPIPDTVLVANDYKLVAKQLKSDMKIKEVIEIIFDKNKTEIKDFYINQKNDYSKLLFEKNPKSFNILSTDTIFTDNDSLKIIPSIKIRK